jgi:hypothetical protein
MVASSVVRHSMPFGSTGSPEGVSLQAVSIVNATL